MTQELPVLAATCAAQPHRLRPAGRGARATIARAIPTADQIRSSCPPRPRAPSASSPSWYVATRNVTRTFNGGTGWVLILIHAIVQFPVTSVERQHLHVGPVERRARPRRVQARRHATIGDGTYDVPALGSLEDGRRLGVRGRSSTARRSAPGRAAGQRRVPDRLRRGQAREPDRRRRRARPGRRDATTSRRATSTSASIVDRRQRPAGARRLRVQRDARRRRRHGVQRRRRRRRHRADRADHAALALAGRRRRAARTRASPVATSADQRRSRRSAGARTFRRSLLHGQRQLRSRPRATSRPARSPRPTCRRCEPSSRL